jgi:hypothetical protein
MFLDLPGVFSTTLTDDAGFVKALGGAYDLIALRGALAAVASSDSRQQQ